jgi:ankyrin repeat protein
MSDFLYTSLKKKYIRLVEDSTNANIFNYLKKLVDTDNFSEFKKVLNNTPSILELEDPIDGGTILTYICKLQDIVNNKDTHRTRPIFLLLIQHPEVEKIINKVDKKGWSALMYACQTCQFFKLKNLVDKGAAVNLGEGHKTHYDEFNDYNTDPLMITLASYTDSYNKRPVDYKDTVELLVNNGAIVGKKAGYIVHNGKKYLTGMTPLHFFALQKNEILTKFVLEKGGYNFVHETNILGDTALMYAAAMNDHKIITLLMDAGARISLPNLKGQTAVRQTPREVFGFKLGKVSPETVQLIKNLYAEKKKFIKDV